MRILREIAPRASQAAIPFLMIGGNAVIAYGFSRQTADLDLLVRDEDCDAWDRLALSIGYAAFHRQANFVMYNPVSAVIPALDLMLVDSPTFARLAADAATVTVAEQPLLIPSLRHLVALKLHALRSGQTHRHERDLLDVVTLLQLHRVDLANPDFVEIFSRYGTPHVRSEIERRLGGLASPGS